LYCRHTPQNFTSIPPSDSIVCSNCLRYIYYITFSSFPSPPLARSNELLGDRRRHRADAKTRVEQHDRVLGVVHDIVGALAHILGVRRVRRQADEHFGRRRRHGVRHIRRDAACVVPPVRRPISDRGGVGRGRRARRYVLGEYRSCTSWRGVVRRGDALCVRGTAAAGRARAVYAVQPLGVLLRRDGECDRLRGRGRVRAERGVRAREQLAHRRRGRRDDRRPGVPEDGLERSVARVPRNAIGVHGGRRDDAVLARAEEV